MRASACRLHDEKKKKETFRIEFITATTSSFLTGTGSHRLKFQDRHGKNKAVENDPATHRCCCEYVVHLVCSGGANAPTLWDDGDNARHDTTAAKIAVGFMVSRDRIRWITKSKARVVDSAKPRPGSLDMAGSFSMISEVSSLFWISSDVPMIVPIVDGARAAAAFRHSVC